MKGSYDVVVVGGGPVGATASRIAAENGANVLLIEGSDPRAKKIPCTGLISLRALKASDIIDFPESSKKSTKALRNLENTGCTKSINTNKEKVAKRKEALNLRNEINVFEHSENSRGFILKKIKGAYIYSPSGRKIELDGGEIKAVVIDRREFDKTLLEKAEKAGVDVRLGCRAVGLDPENGRLKIQHNFKEEIIKAKVIIGADGPRSRVAKWLGLPRPAKMLSALQVIVPHEPERDDYVEVYLGRKIAPNFFGWCVPASNGIARVGLATDNPKHLRSLLNNLVFRRFCREYNDIVAGLIPIGVSTKTYTDGAIIVGDAAGQVKPTSGGGIYTGITCAKIAGEVAARCALMGHTSSKALSEYERRWRDVLYRELFFGFQVHKLLTRLDDTDIDRIISIFDSPDILRLFTEYGDIDYPSHIVRELFKRPTLWAKLLAIIPAKEIFLSLFKVIFT